MIACGLTIECFERSTHSKVTASLQASAPHQRNRESIPLSGQHHPQSAKRTATISEDLSCSSNSSYMYSSSTPEDLTSNKRIQSARIPSMFRSSGDHELSCLSPLALWVQSTHINAFKLQHLLQQLRHARKSGRNQCMSKWV